MFGGGEFRHPISFTKTDENSLGFPVSRRRLFRFFLFLQNGSLSSDYCDFARFQNTHFRGSNMTFLFRTKGIAGDNVGAAHRGRPNPAIVIKKTSRRAGSRFFRSSLEILGKWSWTDFRSHGAMVVKRWSSLCEQACSLPHHFTTTPTGSKSAHDENCFA